jgi:transglutaminase-like putative cysteine protease
LRIVVSHRTVYKYEHAIRYSTQYLRLTPRSNPSQRVIRWIIEGHGRLTPWIDGFGNLSHTLVCDELINEIAIDAMGVVETTDLNGVLPDEGILPVKVFLRPTPLTQASPEIAEFVAPLAETAATNPLETAHALSHALIERIVYEEGSTHVHSTAAEVLKDGRGVCQDMAHLFISCARVLGLPARYISGYLYTGDDEKAQVASHAWAAVWINDLGWVSFDLANKTCGTERHVGLAVGLDYATSAPLRGVRAGGSDREIMDVQVIVAQGQINTAAQ